MLRVVEGIIRLGEAGRIVVLWSLVRRVGLGLGKNATSGRFGNFQINSFVYSWCPHLVIEQCAHSLT